MQLELKPGMYVAVISGMLLYIADWSEKFEDVLVNCMHQATNFPGQLDRASATFPLIMYYAVFKHLFFWVVQGGHTVFKMRQFNRLGSKNFCLGIV